MSPSPFSQALYHGTGIYCLASILATQTLEEGVHWGKPNEPHGPRCSERFELAAAFIRYNFYVGEGGVLVFDWAALDRDYALCHYQDQYVTGEAMPNEGEVAILTPGLPRVDDYLVSIICAPAIIQAAAQAERMTEAMNEGGWPYEMSEAGTQAARQDLKRLAGHPKLNAGLPKDFCYPFNAALFDQSDGEGWFTADGTLVSLAPLPSVPPAAPAY